MPSTELTRKLVATGYCTEGHTDFRVVVIKITGTAEEFVCEVPKDKCPEGMVMGSFVRIFEDSTGLELFEPVWTAEEIAQMQKNVAELKTLLD